MHLVRPPSPSRKKMLMVESADGRSDVEHKTRSRATSIRTSNIGEVSHHKALTISIGQVNLFTTVTLLVVTMVVLLVIVTWQYLNTVNMLKTNTENIINDNSIKNIEMRDTSVLSAQLALETTGQVMMNQSSDLIVSFVNLSIFYEIEQNCKVTRDYIKHGRFDIGNVSHIEQIVKHTYISMLNEPLVYTTFLIGPRSNGNMHAWTVYPTNNWLFRTRYGLMDLCPLSPDGDALIDKCCTGDFKALCNISMTVLNYNPNISNTYDGYFSGPNSELDGYWSPLVMNAENLVAGFSVPLRDKTGYLYGAVNRQYSFRLISEQIRNIADRSFKGMIAYIVEENGLLAAASHGNITYQVRQSSHTYDSAFVIRIPATDSVNPAVSKSAKYLNASGGYKNTLSVQMKVDLGDGLGFYYIIVTKVTHYNLLWYLVVLLPKDELLKSIKQVKESMSQLSDLIEKEGKESLKDTKKRVDTIVVNTMLLIVMLMAFLLIVSGTVAWVTNRAISGPLKNLATRLEMASQLVLSDVEKKRKHKRLKFMEIEQLYKADNMVNSALTSFQLYVPPQVVLQIVSKAKEARLYLRKAQTTVMFMDIAGFTGLCEKLDPLDLHAILGDFMEEMSNVLIEHSATIDKYIGDCIMAFWNAPQHVPDHQAVACEALLKCNSTLEELHSQWELHGLPKLSFRAGVHTGEVLVGNVGSSKRLNYTVLGDVVNTASRLEALNKQFCTSILCSGTILRFTNAHSKRFLSRYLGKIKLVGKSTYLDVHELVTSVAHANSLTYEAVITNYQQAMDLAIEGNYEAALSRLGSSSTYTEEELRNRILSARTYGGDVELVSQKDK